MHSSTSCVGSSNCWLLKAPQVQWPCYPYQHHCTWWTTQNQARVHHHHHQPAVFYEEHHCNQEHNLVGGEDIMDIGPANEHHHRPYGEFDMSKLWERVANLVRYHCYWGGGEERQGIWCVPHYAYSCGGGDPVWWWCRTTQCPSVATNCPRGTPSPDAMPIPTSTFDQCLSISIILQASPALLAWSSITQVRSQLAYDLVWDGKVPKDKL